MQLSARAAIASLGLAVASDGDLASALPEPPPPRPAAPRAAIDEALLRFDGHGAGNRAASRDRAIPPRRSWIGRPQIAALATLALVVAIGVPTWIAERDKLPPAAEQ